MSLSHRTPAHTITAPEVALLPDEDENPAMDLYAALASAGESLLLAAGAISARLDEDDQVDQYILRDVDRWIEAAITARRRYGQRVPS